MINRTAYVAKQRLEHSKKVSDNIANYNLSPRGRQKKADIIKKKIGYLPQPDYTSKPGKRYQSPYSVKNTKTKQASPLRPPKSQVAWKPYNPPVKSKVVRQAAYQPNLQRELERNRAIIRPQTAHEPKKKDKTLI